MIIIAHSVSSALQNYSSRKTVGWIHLQYYRHDYMQVNRHRFHHNGYRNIGIVSSLVKREIGGIVAIFSLKAIICKDIHCRISGNEIESKTECENIHLEWPAYFAQRSASRRLEYKCNINLQGCTDGVLLLLLYCKTSIRLFKAATKNLWSYPWMAFCQEPIISLSARINCIVG